MISKGILTQKEEWLYPDSPLSALPEKITIHTVANGKRGLQLLMEAKDKETKIIFEGNEHIDVEIFQMIDIPVEHNTESSTAQNGAFVIMKEISDKPEYCTRMAPFRVYDCLKPSSNTFKAINGRFAIYLCFSPTTLAGPGERKIKVKVESLNICYELEVCIYIHGVHIPEGKFKVTNWFNLRCIAHFHNVSENSTEYLDMVRKYARAMRRTRQTHFFLSIIAEKCLKSKNPWEFDFTYLKAVAEIFFEEGFSTIELGNFATKGKNLFTDELKCSIDPNIKVSSDEGYFLINKLINALGEFLRENGWEDRVIFHICDEPDVHIKNSEVLEKRKQQYFKVASILRKHIPSARIIEAVKSAEFKSGVDIWTPLTINYEELKGEFDKLIEEGDEVWTYVCCCPQGHYLNRFMDIDLIRPRLIFWGCSKYKLSGYLHWGFNWYVANFNPFERSCCPNETGHGTSYPSGDAHIVYPGDDGPWISMRLEAQRRGIEDYELLELLRSKDVQKYNQLMDKTFTSNLVYNKNVDDFEAVYIELLKSIL